MGEVLRLVAVTKWFGDKLVLDGVDWTVKPPEHWALLGLNGSGKTTLLRIASGHLWPTSGEVTLLGHKFGSVDLRRLRKSVGWVTSALTSRTPPGMPAIDVVVSGRFDSVGLYEEPTKEDLRKASELMEFMELEGLSSRPFGVLSQGEQQRILIARALASEPKVLILDEPCVGLDMKARETFLKAVSKLAQDGPTLIYVTHHIEEIIPEISHVMLLCDGRIRAKGPKQSVLDSRTLSDAFNMKIEVESRNKRVYAKVQ